MREITHACLAVALAAAGMAGLYFKIEYSGWAFAAGLLVAVRVSDRMEQRDGEPK